MFPVIICVAREQNSEVDATFYGIDVGSLSVYRFSEDWEGSEKRFAGN
jgi:hypothetical protein